MRTFEGKHMLDVLEIKPERSDVDGVDMSRETTGNMFTEECRGWTYTNPKMLLKRTWNEQEKDTEKREWWKRMIFCGTSEGKNEICTKRHEHFTPLLLLLLLCLRDPLFLVLRTDWWHLIFSWLHSILADVWQFFDNFVMEKVMSEIISYFFVNICTSAHSLHLGCQSRPNWFSLNPSCFLQPQIFSSIYLFVWFF